MDGEFQAGKAYKVFQGPFSSQASSKWSALKYERLSCSHELHCFEGGWAVIQSKSWNPASRKVALEPGFRIPWLLTMPLAPAQQTCRPWRVDRNCRSYEVKFTRRVLSWFHTGLIVLTLLRHRWCGDQVAGKAVFLDGVLFSPDLYCFAALAFCPYCD